MAVLRTDIERALDELASQEEGMRFQGLAVVLGKMRWPELIARQRKKDFGLDAYAPASLTKEGIGKGLAASITPTLTKISKDAKTARENFPDLKKLLFVTSAKIGNADRERWQDAIQKEHALDLYILEREEIIAQLMMPANGSLLISSLYLHIDAEPQVIDLIDRIRRAASEVTRNWIRRTEGYPLIELTAERLDRNGIASINALTLEQIDEVLSQGGRIVLEGPAGRGKTTTLTQIAERTHTNAIPFIVELPAWTSSGKGVLDFIAGMSAFQAERLTSADLACAQQTVPFRFLLNGWNEVAEANSSQAGAALRELERTSPSAGIIVASRPHHLSPPLPDALRLRLLPLRCEQRADYMVDRLGEKCDELLTRIVSDPSLDELTRTPFILSEVVSLYEAGVEIPTTRIGIFEQAISLQEQRDEHKNALQIAPLYGLQTEYMKALAIEMTRRGTVSLPEADVRAAVSSVAREVVRLGQIERVGAPSVIATLTAHHILERVDYPHPAYRFAHQQFQEFYTAIELRAQLLELTDDDATNRFTANYVNDPAWAESLRMIAETTAKQSDVSKSDEQGTRAGAKLVRMALAVDLVFAGELAHLCGAAVWSEVRAAVGERFRVVYAIGDENYRQYALAAMLATGSDDFSDIIVPLLAGPDQQTRLATYRLWPDFHTLSLGSNWREQVCGWHEDARADFVSELLHHCADGEVAAFAADDKSISVKKAAVSGLTWTGSDDDALIRVLESMDAETFEDVVRVHADLMPAGLRARTIAAMRSFIERSTDHPARLRTVLGLIELGEACLDDMVKEAMVGLLSGEMRDLPWDYMRQALKYLRENDPAWTSEWVATQVAEGVLPYGHDYWLPFATAIPDSVVEKNLLRMESEDLRDSRLDGMEAVIAARADAKLAARVFVELRELRRKVDSKPDQQHEFECRVMDQLKALFRRLADDVAVAGILSSVATGDPLDITVTTNLLNRIAQPDTEPLRIVEDGLKARLRAYLKDSVDLVVAQDDHYGNEKANLALSIAQVGQPEDMADLVTLIRADIERLRRGRAACVAGHHGPRRNGGFMSQANWHLAAVMYLDAAGAEQVLIDLLSEPEYRSAAAAAMARDGGASQFGEGRRERFAAALNAEVSHLREQNQDRKHVAGLKELAGALATVDGRESESVVFDVLGRLDEWDHHTRVGTLEQLMTAGVVLRASTVFALVDSVLERNETWARGPDRYLLRRILALCPFVDDPAAGVAKMRDVLNEHRFGGYELLECVTALGERRSDAAIDLLYELASDPQTFEQYDDNTIGALSVLDPSRAGELVLSFVDPDIPGITLTCPPRREDMFVTRLTRIVEHNSEAVARLRELCGRDLPEVNRCVLSRIMVRLGTPATLAANLNLIDDAKPSPIPRGVQEQIEAAFVERRPYEGRPNTITGIARASNELRASLFRMAHEDPKRRQSAFRLLGEIEIWRLERGRPTDEPRHPNLASVRSWPPMESVPS